MTVGDENNKMNTIVCTVHETDFDVVLFELLARDVKRREMQAFF
jgi:hypothetical protein